MRGGSGILARNNFAGRANPSRIFAGQARGGPMRGGLARFAIPTCNHKIKGYINKILLWLLTPEGRSTNVIKGSENPK